MLSFKDGKKRRGIFLMINLIKEFNYIRVVLKEVIFNFLRVIVTGSMQHVQYRINSQHDFVFEWNLYTLFFFFFLHLMNFQLSIIDLLQKLELVSEELQKDQNSICIRNQLQKIRWLNRNYFMKQKVPFIFKPSKIIVKKLVMTEVV